MRKTLGAHPIPGGPAGQSPSHPTAWWPTQSAVVEGGAQSHHLAQITEADFAALDDVNVPPEPGNVDDMC